MTIHIDHEDAILRLLEAATSLDNQPMYRAGNNYLADEGNNVFIKVHPRPDGFSSHLVVECRPELGHLDFIAAKVGKLEELIQEIFSDSHLPFKNRRQSADE